MSLFAELGLVIILATALGFLVYMLRQPLILAYILTGVVLGPALLNRISSGETFEVFGKIGITFLLFMVGLNLNYRHLQQVGKIALITGVGQVVFTSFIGYIICAWLGYTHIEALYISVAISFSSTIIVVKLLSDKNDLDTLYGKISVGFLLVQDFIAVLALMIMSSIQKDAAVLGVMEQVLKVAGLLILVFLVSRYVIPYICRHSARSQELLFMFGISWCFVVALFSWAMGFSIEIGAFLAGVALATQPFIVDLVSKIKPLRDFFLVMFFVALGTQMNITSASGFLMEAIVLSIFVLIGNPIIVMILMGIFGYKKRTGFLAGLTVAQISEFSLILIMLGGSKGLYGPDVLSMVSMVGLVTMLGSSYMILYGDKIYRFFSPILGIFERKNLVEEISHTGELQYRICLFGYNRTGYSILKTLNKLKKPFLIIDHNPDIVAKMTKDGMSVKYGDADDEELYQELNIHKVEMIISTIPTYDTNIMLINKVREVNKKAIIIITSHHIEEALEFYERGADYVILPHYISGDHASMIIENFGTDFNKFLKYKVQHIRDLRMKHAHHISMQTF